jgi:GT2 family glycosyltransferase
VRISVVISTLDRADGLRLTLEALRFQRHRDFEVIVVEGPSDIGWGQLVSEQHHWVRRVRCEEANLARSRNLGIAAASGEVVAFIDDDAVPEPHWLAELAAAYEDERVAGAGGIVCDRTGLQLQFEYALCDRLGRTRFDCRPPFSRETLPGADPFLYLQGTNMSFRRDRLVAIGGFDEQLVYIYDDVDVSLRMIDAGAHLRPLAGGVVHHRCLASPVRRADGFIFDPFTLAEGRAYFAFRHGPSAEEAEHSLPAFAQELQGPALSARAAGRSSAAELELFIERLEAGLQSGWARALATAPGRSVLPASDPAGFRPYPLLTGEHPLRVCVFCSDPALRDAGVMEPGTDANELARSLAADGHDVHVFTRARDRSVVEFDGALWTHNLVVQDRCLPALADKPFAFDLYAAAANYHEVQRLHERAPVDMVVAPGEHRESLICSLDRRFSTVTRALTSSCDPDPRGEPVQVEELAPVLEGVAQDAWPSAREAAAELLDSSSYPFDLVAALLAVWDAPAPRFTDVVFFAALGREPDEDTRAVWHAHIYAGHSRHDLLDSVLCSAEARERGVPADALDRFRRALAAWAPVQLRRAWELPDRAFTKAAYQWTLGRTPDPEYGAKAISDLEGGALRLDVLARLSNSAEASARGMPAGMLETLSERLRVTLPQRLKDAFALSDAQFICAVHVALLWRTPDAGLHEDWMFRLASGEASRLDLLDALTRSEVAAEPCVSAS